MKYLIFLSILFLIPILLYWLFYFFGYLMYKNSTKKGVKNWDYASFEEFQEQFKKYDWYNFEGILLDFLLKCKIDEFICNFEGNGMIFNFIDYYKYLIFIKKERDQRIGKQFRGLWNKKLRVIK